jgi:hypothetical protein
VKLHKTSEHSEEVKCEGSKSKLEVVEGKLEGNEVKLRAQGFEGELKVLNYTEDQA